MLDPKEEKKWQEYLLMCRDLKIPSVPFVFIKTEKYSKDGELLESSFERAHSWTRNFYNYMFAALSAATTTGTNNFGAGYMTSKAYNATISYSVGYDEGKSSTQMGSGFINNTQTNTFGVIVGTNNTAFDKDQYAMSAVIGHGVGSGQLWYHAQGRPYTAYTAGTKTWATKINRFLENMDSASITIREAGLYWYGTVYSSGTLYVMMERTVLASTITLARGEIAKIEYTITMDFSAID